MNLLGLSQIAYKNSLDQHANPQTNLTTHRRALSLFNPRSHLFYFDEAFYLASSRKNSHQSQLPSRSSQTRASQLTPQAFGTACTPYLLSPLDPVAS
mmetsp:Transcript_10114/g.37655  ORF Transcript_10114/g.37655 Transcript_10114/m.37655 type:complete len:97 (-) Transcript_10114:216-506(-)